MIIVYILDKIFIIEILFLFLWSVCLKAQHAEMGNYVNNDG